MNLFDVYPLMNLEPAKAKGSLLWDKKGEEYLDLYGGHAVISIGHSHPHYVSAITDQLNKMGFYSNSVQNPLQEKLAKKLGQVSGCEDYDLFLCNSGAEANENALKLASFHTGRKKIVAFSKGFHGRTSLAVAATDNPKVVAPANQTDNVVFGTFNQTEGLDKLIDKETACVIVEGIQGVGGVHVASNEFLTALRTKCDEVGALLILDEVQSGYGRSGKFFAFQHTDVVPDIISVAKGMGNGFPIGGVLIGKHIGAWHGMLGTTFGGNYLACAAALAVLEVIEKDGLTDHAAKLGSKFITAFRGIEGVEEVRGEGLMIGLKLNQPCAPIRKQLVEDHHILTGNASCPNTLRILPALNVSEAQLVQFQGALKTVLADKNIKFK